MVTDGSGENSAGVNQGMTVEAAYAQAVEHFNQELFADADRLCTAIIQAVPDHVEALNLLGVIAQRINRHDLALTQFQRAIDRGISSFNIHYNMGISLRALGRSTEAVATLQKALEFDPANQAVANLINDIKAGLDIICSEEGRNISLDEALQKAVAAQRDADLNSAIQWYRKILAVKPDNLLALGNIGSALSRSGGLDEAAVHLEKAISLKPDFIEAHSNLGLVANESGRVDDAIACYRKALEIDPNFKEACYNLGIIMYDLGRLDEAVVLFENLLRRHPDSAHAWYNHGNILKDRGDMDAAIASYAKAAAIEPEHVKAVQNLGVALRFQGRLDEAATHLLKAVTIKPDYAMAHFNLGVVYKKQCNIDVAINHFQRAATIDHDYADAFYNLGLAYLAKCDASREKIHDVEIIDPDHTDALLKPGFVHGEAGHAALAVANIRKALKITPDSGLYWIGFATSIKYLNFSSHDQSLLDDMLLMLEQPTVRHNIMSGTVIQALRKHPDFAYALSMSDSNTISANIDVLCERLSGIPLLLKVLELSAIAVLDIEALLTRLRCAMLERVLESNPVNAGLAFYRALALHCFTNEYLFFESERETAGVGRLEEMIRQGLDDGDVEMEL